MQSSGAAHNNNSDSPQAASKLCRRSHCVLLVCQLTASHIVSENFSAPDTHSALN